MLSALIRGASTLGKTVTSGTSRKAMTKAEKAIAKSLKKKGYTIPKTPKAEFEGKVTYGRREIK